MASPIGVNVTVNNNMDHCCPRRIRVFGCCCTTEEEDKKTEKVSEAVFKKEDQTQESE